MIVPRQLVMEGGLGGRQHNADIAMATTFWLSVGYNFGCMIASNTLFNSRGGFLGSSYTIKT